MPIDVAGAKPVTAAAELDAWLGANGAAREVVVAIFNKASARQTTTLRELQEVALCHGWVDTQTKRVDAERYAVRFVPRRPGSRWGTKNRAMARRMLAAGRVTPAGRAALPGDL